MLCTLLERHAAERPRHPAIIDAEFVLSWRELDERVRRLAGGLSERGVRRGDSVALVFPNSWTLVAGFLALARLGAVAVPLPADWKSAEILAALRGSGCTTLLGHDSLAPLCGNLLRNGVLRLAFVAGVGDGDAPGLDRIVTDHVGRLSASPPDETADLLELTSSGTTGQPRRIFRTHAHLLRLAEAYTETVGITGTDRILAVIPLSHGHGLCSTFLASLQSGATLYVRPRFDRRATLQLLSRERITVFPAVPFIFSVLADTRTNAPVDLRKLRLCITGGAPLARTTWAKVRDRLGISLRQSYGSSETGAATINMDDNPEASAESVGRPLSGVELTLRDDEVFVRSPAAAEWASPPRNGACDNRTRLSNADGWIATGDLGQLQDGRLYVTGRAGLAINVAGRKVHPEEVERILEAFPQVREAAVIPASDAYGEEAVKAIVVAARCFDARELLTHCRRYLADYKVPRVVEFRKSLPRNAHGKIDRRQLREPLRVKSTSSSAFSG